MDPSEFEPSRGMQFDPAGMNTIDLIRESMANASLLVRRQFDLLLLELESTRRQEQRAVTRLVVAAGLGLVGIVLLLSAGAMGVAQVFVCPLWAVTACVGTPVLAGSLILARAGWVRRVSQLLPLSRDEVEKEMKWLETRNR